jgi:ariadne-1
MSSDYEYSDDDVDYYDDDEDMMDTQEDGQYSWSCASVPGG